MPLVLPKRDPERASQHKSLVGWTVDLIHSAPDALASTANFLKGYGWRSGEPWSEGTENFNVLLEWNKARVYAKTIAAYAERLAASSR